MKSKDMVLLSWLFTMLGPPTGPWWTSSTTRRCLRSRTGKSLSGTFMSMYAFDSEAQLQCSNIQTKKQTPKQRLLLYKLVTEVMIYITEADIYFNMLHKKTWSVYIPITNLVVEIILHHYFSNQHYVLIYMLTTL